MACPPRPNGNANGIGRPRNGGTKGGLPPVFATLVRVRPSKYEAKIVFRADDSRCTRGQYVVTHACTTPRTAYTVVDWVHNVGYPFFGHT